jgi:hypothetical protein
MTELNRFSANADGLSTVSNHELGKIEGGQCAVSYYIDTSSMSAFYTSLVVIANTQMQSLKAAQ